MCVWERERESWGVWWGCVAQHARVIRCPPICNLLIIQQIRITYVAYHQELLLLLLLVVWWWSVRQSESNKLKLNTRAGGGARRAAGRGAWRPRGRLCRLALVGLEADLQHAVAERVAVERLDGHHRFVVVCHRHEAEALALVRLQVADHLHALHGAEWPKQLPQHILLGLRR